MENSLNAQTVRGRFLFCPVNRQRIHDEMLSGFFGSGQIPHDPDFTDPGSFRIPDQQPAAFLRIGAPNMFRHPLKHSVRDFRCAAH